MEGLVIDAIALEEMLRGPDGMVYRHLMEKAALVQDAAKAQIERNKREQEADTGKLKASIVKRNVIYDGDPTVSVGTDTIRYALWVHNGNGPPGGFIFPVKSKVLVFTSNGVKYFRPWVKTSKPNRYLVDNLVLAIT
jgi:hypothetical protein